MRDQYLTILERVVARVERSLATPLSLDELSREAALSKFHLHRVFHAMTGLPLAEYVRRRRLAESLRALANPERPVLEVALESGFSHEQSYIRAFKARWGLTPGSWRAKKTLLEVTEPIATDSLTSISEESALLAPRLVVRPPMNLCGVLHLVTDAENAADNAVARVANRFLSEDFPRIAEAAFSDRYVGYVEHCPDQSVNRYHACAELKKAPKGPPPEGMRHVRIERGSFREFLLVSRVHPSRIGWNDVASLYGAVWGDWLPRHGECARAGWHLEYVDLSAAAEDYGEFRILLPIG